MPTTFSNGACGNTTNSSTCGDTWNVWVDGTAASDETVRATWHASDSIPNLYQIEVLGAWPPLSPEEQARRDTEAEQRRQEQERRLQEKREAEDRAKALLSEFLTPDQVKSLEEQSAILVESELNRMYRIKKGRSGNIEELDAGGKVINRLCVHPVDLVPDFDTMLIQMLWLQNDESQLRRIANITPVRT